MGRILVTGGAGFIGSNLVRALLDGGRDVVLFDNLSRKGTAANLEWLKSGPGRKRLRSILGDVRDPAALAKAVTGVETVFHFAAQVAVTTSVVDPRTDFEVNAAGTVNVLEAVRAMRSPAAVVFTSTNKVYGGLPHVKVRESAKRCRMTSRQRGIPETEPLDFHSPYGCSKGTADQYVRDYGRIYGLLTTVFRMSCIYGTRQFGTEDQGWVAHFMLRAARREPVTIYGTGKQVRDLLYISDLVSAFQLAAKQMAAGGPGGVFNIGGGPANTLSLIELVESLEAQYGRKLEIDRAEWRPGDQPIYVSDISLAREKLGWQPAITVPEGLTKLASWMPEAIRILDRQKTKPSPRSRKRAAPKRNQKLHRKVAKSQRPALSRNQSPHRKVAKASAK